MLAPPAAHPHPSARTAQSSARISAVRGAIRTCFQNQGPRAATRRWRAGASMLAAAVCQRCKVAAHATSADKSPHAQARCASCTKAAASGSRLRLLAAAHAPRARGVPRQLVAYMRVCAAACCSCHHAHWHDGGGSCMSVCPPPAARDRHQAVLVHVRGTRAGLPVGADLLPSLMTAPAAACASWPCCCSDLMQGSTPPPLPGRHLMHCHHESTVDLNCTVPWPVALSSKPPPPRPNQPRWRTCWLRPMRCASCRLLSQTRRRRPSWLPTRWMQCLGACARLHVR